MLGPRTAHRRSRRGGLVACSSLALELGEQSRALVGVEGFAGPLDANVLQSLEELLSRLAAQSVGVVLLFNLALRLVLLTGPGRWR